jgi:amidohydrolase
MPGSTESLPALLLAALEDELPHAVELRHRLHADPELAHAEVRTAAMIERELPVGAAAIAGTGLLARVGGDLPDPAVAVRAELDGLPLRERTGASFSSSGDTMHACGHDVHMAALVALARAAQGLAGELPAPLLALFQPSEEAYPSGAEQIGRELGDTELGGIVAAHVHPELPWGAVGLEPGIVNASCDAVAITVHGEPTHGAYPHAGRDPILALAEIVVALHAQVGRRIDPLHPASLTIGAVEGGGAENVIPASASARGALRAYRHEDRARLRELVRDVADGVAAAHGCRAEVELIEGEPALDNDAGIVDRARGLLPDAGLQAAREWRSCGSDDFAFLGARAPLAMGFVGLVGADGFDPRPLHHPELLVPDEAVGTVARVQALLYLAAAGWG